MTLTIYGSPRSRTMRVLWAAAELGLAYNHVPLEWDDPALKQPAFLRINPAGAVPAIDDDGLVLSESLAINLYLAKTYGAPPFYPAASEAQVWRWSLWAQGGIEPWVCRDARLADVHTALATHGAQEVRRSLALLDRVLAEQPFLLSEDFSIADLNVAGVLSPSRAANIDWQSHKHARAWLTRCYARPAAVETRRKFAA